MSTNSDQAVNKGYVHTKLANKVNSSIFQNGMRQVLYKADKRDLESYLKRDGSLNITGNLNVNNYTKKDYQQQHINQVIELPQKITF